MSVAAGVGPARQAACTLRDVFTIPEVARADDYVLRLSASVQSDQVAATLATDVVTDELAHAFDQALAVVEEAQRTGQNKGVSGGLVRLRQEPLHGGA